MYKTNAAREMDSKVMRGRDGYSRMTATRRAHAETCRENAYNIFSPKTGAFKYSQAKRFPGAL